MKSNDLVNKIWYFVGSPAVVDSQKTERLFFSHTFCDVDKARSVEVGVPYNTHSTSRRMILVVAYLFDSVSSAARPKTQCGAHARELVVMTTYRDHDMTCSEKLF